MLNPQALALAYALSTVAGLRASLTVLALSIAVHQHVIAVPASMTWLASDVTVVIAAVFALADAFADKVPVVDHALHLVHGVLAPVAGGIAGSALMPEVVGPGGGTASAAVAPAGIAFAAGGAVIAFVVNALRGAIRAATSAASLGVLNPVVSVAEDICAIGALIAAFIAPFVAAAAVLALTLAGVLLASKAMRAAAARRRRSAVSP